jgi:hypothetical protein
MSNLTLIHAARQRKGSLRQSHHYGTLRRLELALIRNVWSHPYDKKYGQIAPLLGNPSLRLVPGAQGTSGAPSGEYIYHLTSVRKVLKHTAWSFFPSGFPSPKHEDEKLFAYLVKDHAWAGGWLPLSPKYASGKLSGFRDFTWWTSAELDPKYILCQAHALGLPNKWISKHALILRCRVDYVVAGGLAFVPTVMDGFLSEIFSPADYRGTHPPAYGKTIDLDGPGPLTEGEEEFAVRPLEVSEIEFRPVLIDRPVRLKHVVRRDARLWQLLENYYNKP